MAATTQDERVTIGPGAIIGMHLLPAPERERLMDTLNRLAETPVEQWPADTVRRWRTDEPLYMLRANEELRVLLQREPGGRITVLHMVLQETLDRYFTPRSNGHP
jgi:hypothetical protein